MLCGEVNDYFYGIVNSPKRPTTLSEICLETIAQNFESYFQYYFKKTEDPHVKKKFQLLGKAYSDELMSQLTRQNFNNELEPKYIGFVLNEYLTELNATDLNRCDEDSVLTIMREVGHGIKKLRLFYDYDDRHDLFDQLIPCVKNVEVIKFLLRDEDNQINCSDKTLRIVAENCTKLRELHYFSRYKFQGMLSPTVIKELLDRVPTLVIFGYGPLAEALYQIHSALMQEGQSALPTYNLTSLKIPLYLRIHSKNYKRMVDACSILCPHLKSLSLPILKNGGLEMVLKFLKMENLEIFGPCHGTYCMVMSNPIIQHFNQLKELKLHNVCISLRALAKNCSLLQALLLHDVEFIETNTDSLVPFDNLEVLHLRGMSFYQFGDFYVVFNGLLRNVPKLRSLTFRDCSYHRRGDLREHFASYPCCTLKHLTYVKCNVRFCFLKTVIPSCSVLDSLHMRNCGVKFKHEQMLKEMANAGCFVFKCVLEMEDYENESCFCDVYDSSD